jgi:ABC-2 type transport system ATP-binding protein
MSSKEVKSQTRFPLLQGGVGVRLTLTNTGKRFNREWIFRHLSYEFMPGRTYAITGPNGSGKSTLLQVIAGAVLHNEGSIEYTDARYPVPDKNANPDTINHQPSTSNTYQYLSIAAPYLELIEEMTAKEMLQFHAQFKSLSLPVTEILQNVGLANATNKQLRNFSSGMKQRLKLAQAFFSNTPLLLLDEPTTNLDADGIALYLQLINDHSKDKLVIISSNDKQEYDFCEEVIEMSKYKFA